MCICYESYFMVVEILQKYIFIFNILLSKKLYIFIFNQKIFLFCKNFVIQRKYIYLYLIKIYLSLKNDFIQTDFFPYKKHIFIQLKQNVFNEIFLFNEYR